MNSILSRNLYTVGCCGEFHSEPHSASGIPTTRILLLLFFKNRPKRNILPDHLKRTLKMKMDSCALGATTVAKQSPILYLYAVHSKFWLCQELETARVAAKQTS